MTAARLSLPEELFHEDSMKISQYDIDDTPGMTSHLVVVSAAARALLTGRLQFGSKMGDDHSKRHVAIGTSISQ